MAGLRELVGSGNFALPFSWVVPKLSQLYASDWPAPRLAAEVCSVLGLLLAVVLAIRLLPEWRSLTPVELTLLGVVALTTILSMKVYSQIFDYGRVLAIIPFLALLPLPAAGRGPSAGWRRASPCWSACPECDC